MAFCVQGLSSLTSGFANYEARKKVIPTEKFLVLLATIKRVPFFLNPIYAFVSDVFPVLGYRFKSFIIGCLFIQMVICVILFVLEDPSLGTLLVLDVMLNITSAFVNTLLEGMVTIVTKIDSKIRYPEFLKNSEVFESKSLRYIGVYEFLVLLGYFLFRYLNFYASINKIVSSEEKIYLVTGVVTFTLGIIIMFYLKEKKVSETKIELSLEAIFSLWS